LIMIVGMVLVALSVYRGVDPSQNNGQYFPLKIT